MASRLNFSTGAIVNPLEGLQQSVATVGSMFDKYVQREQDREDRLAREAEDRRRYETQLGRYDRQEQESLRRYEEGKELNKLEREEARKWKEKEFGLRETEAKQRSEAAEQTRRLNSLILEEKEGDRKAATLMSSPEFKAQIKDAYLNSEDANKGLLAVGNEINKGGSRVQAVVNSTFDALPGVKPDIKPDDLQGRLKYLEDVANTSTDLTVKSAAQNAIESHNAFYKDLAGLRSINYDQSSGNSTNWGTGRNNENSRLDSLIHNVAATADKETVYDLARQQALASGASVAGADKAAEYVTRGMMTQAERTAATLKQLKAEAEILSEVNPKGKGSVNVNVSGGSGDNSTVGDGEKSVNTNPFITASNLANKLSYSPGVGTDAAPRFSSLVTPLIEKHKTEGVPVDNINDALQEIYLSGSGNVRDKGNFDIGDETAAAIFAKHANKPKPSSQPNTLKTNIESRLAAINNNPEVARSLAVVESAMPSLGDGGLARTGEQRAVKFVQDLKAVPTSRTVEPRQTKSTIPTSSQGANTADIDKYRTALLNNTEYSPRTIEFALERAARSGNYDELIEMLGKKGGFFTNALNDASLSVNARYNTLAYLAKNAVNVPNAYLQQLLYNADRAQVQDLLSTEDNVRNVAAATTLLNSRLPVSSDYKAEGRKLAERLGITK